MAAPTRDDILAEIRRTAEANGGVPLGRERFARETGIKESAFLGRHWASWGDAVREAGLAVNAWNAALPEEHLLVSYVNLTRELGQVPTSPQMRLKRRTDPTFPNDKVFLARFGSKADLLARARKFCGERPELADVLEILGGVVQGSVLASKRDEAPIGFVYLIRFARHYKIGRTNAVGRREREVALQLPDKTKTVHVIETDDPIGIEAYWHNRFAAKRGNGEWFALDNDDIRAFKRRKFM